MACRCDPAVVAECLCSMQDSDTVDFSGSGTSEFPFTADVKLDATTVPVGGNKLLATDYGLLVPTMPYCKIYATEDYELNSMATIRFGGIIDDPWTMSSTSDTDFANHKINILYTRWYRVHARATIYDDAALDYAKLYIQDEDGLIIAQCTQPRITSEGQAIETEEYVYLASGKSVTCAIKFTGPAGLTIQGGGSYGHRTNFSVVGENVYHG